MRTDVTDGDGTYTVTNLGPGTYDVKAELAGFQPTTKRGRAGRRPGRQRVAGSSAWPRSPNRDGARPPRRCSTSSSAKIGVNVSPEEVRTLPVNGRNFANLMTLATGATSRRQRRLGERAVQRQVEPAELPELRRRRRHLRVGRQPRLPERHRLAVPPADVDGVGRRVPRQLGPGAGRERPRRRRQHHRRQQERQQPLPGSLFEYKRDDALDSASKYDDAEAAARRSTSSAARSAARCCATRRSSSSATRACARRPA